MSRATRRLRLCAPVALVTCLCIAASCMPAYQRGDLPVGSGALALTTPCLDLVASPTFDPMVPAGLTVLAYEFGNACEHSVALNLASARVTVRDGHSASLALSLFDPGREVSARHLLPGQRAREVLVYGPRHAIEQMEACVRRLDPDDARRAACLDNELAALDATVCLDASLVADGISDDAVQCWPERTQDGDTP